MEIRLHKLRCLLNSKIRSYQIALFKMNERDSSYSFRAQHFFFITFAMLYRIVAATLDIASKAMEFLHGGEVRNLRGS